MAQAPAPRYTCGTMAPPGEVGYMECERHAQGDMEDKVGTNCCASVAGVCIVAGSVDGSSGSSEIPHRLRRRTVNVRSPILWTGMRGSACEWIRDRHRAMNCQMGKREQRRTLDLNRYVAACGVHHKGANVVHFILATAAASIFTPLFLHSSPEAPNG